MFEILQAAPVSLGSIGSCFFTNGLTANSNPFVACIVNPIGAQITAQLAALGVPWLANIPIGLVFIALGVFELKVIPKLSQLVGGGTIILGILLGILQYHLLLGF